ncbi:MAG: alpha/beta fold hydrolase [Burkholderiales bacterium]
MMLAGGRCLRVALLSLSLLVAGCASQATLDCVYSVERTLSGVSEKSLQVGDHNWVYAEKGEGEVVLLLHGFGASKEVWMRMVGDMPRGYRYIMPDLTGFGRSTYLPEGVYDVARQVPRLEAFVSALGVARFHLLGNSMGGNLAASYAAAYPQRVTTLGLFAPSGVSQPNPSPYTRAYLERGEPKLIAASREDYRQIFKDAFVDPPYAPDFLLNSLADAQVARRGEYLRMYQQFWGRRTPLEPLLPGLAMPALLLWGDQDKILDVSAAQVFKQGLPHVEAVIWPNVGHAPMLEKAADSARLYAGFIGRYPVR